MQQSKSQEDSPSSSQEGVLTSKDKGKAIIEVDQLEEKNSQVQPRRSKTRTMERKENHVKEPSTPQAQNTKDDTVVDKLEKEKEYQLEKVNQNLEKLLKK